MRIFITGPTGSGKSTLAHQLSKKLNLTHHPLDHIHWMKQEGGNVRRPLEEKLVMLEKITSTPHWIIEGVQFKWADLAIEYSDLIIVLDVGRLLNHCLIIKRFIKQRFNIEHAAYQPTIKKLFQIFEWSADYKREERELLLNKISPYSSKVKIFKSSSDAEKLITQFLKSVPSSAS